MNKENSYQNDMKKEILSWISSFAVAIIAALLIVTFIGIVIIHPDDTKSKRWVKRVIGPVPRKRIIGKAFVRIYPFSKFGLIKHTEI